MPDQPSDQPLAVTVLAEAAAVDMPETIDSLLDEYLTGLCRNGLKPATLRAYGGDLGAAAAAFPKSVRELRREALECGSARRVRPAPRPAAWRVCGVSLRGV